MATRPFSVNYRRNNLVDLLIPKQEGVQGYRIRGAANFDGMFSDLFTVDIGSGYLGPGADRRFLHAINNPGAVRAAFDPDQEGLTDLVPFWLTLVPVDFDGNDGAETLPVMILPYDAHDGDGRTVIRGDAPDAMTVADSLAIGLPGRVQDLVITNHDAMNTLVVAFQPGGSEEVILAATTWTAREGAIEHLLVRGGGAVVNFSASFTSFLPL